MQQLITGEIQNKNYGICRLRLQGIKRFSDFNPQKQVRSVTTTQSNLSWNWLILKNVLTIWQLHTSHTNTPKHTHLAY